MELVEKLECIGRRIKLIRVAKGIRQYDIAKSMGISQAHLSNIERGRNSVTLENLIKLQILLECPISEFFCDIEERIKDQKSDVSMADLQNILALLKKVKA